MSTLSPYDRRATARLTPSSDAAAAAPAMPPAERETSDGTPAAGCRNCGAERMGEYCCRCGQHFLEDRLSFRLLATEAWERVVERGLLHTLRDMMLGPGHVVRRYVSGQRRRYVSPLSYLLVGAALSLVFFQFTRDQLAAYMRARATAAFVDSRHPLLTEAQTEEYVRLTMLVSQNTTYVALVLCVVFALLLRLLFRRQGINLVESSVFALFTFGHVYYLSIPLSLLFIAGVGSIGQYIYATFPLYLLVCGLAAAQYFERRAWSAVKAALALLISYGVFATGINVAIVTYLRWPGR